MTKIGNVTYGVQAIGVAGNCEIHQSFLTDHQQQHQQHQQEEDETSAEVEQQSQQVGGIFVYLLSNIGNVLMSFFLLTCNRKLKATADNLDGINWMTFPLISRCQGIMIATLSMVWISP